MGIVVEAWDSADIVSVCKKVVLCIVISYFVDGCNLQGVREILFSVGVTSAPLHSQGEKMGSRWWCMSSYVTCLLLRKKCQCCCTPKPDLHFFEPLLCYLHECLTEVLHVFLWFSHLSFVVMCNLICNGESVGEKKLF